MEAFKDTDLMPFGKYKGTIMVDVPAFHLMWHWNEYLSTDSEINMSIDKKKLKKYIVDNMEVFKKELKQK
jgi:uncharacterized protein (DUF3820 family)